MTLASLSALLAVWIAAIVSPGPDLVQMVRVGSRSRVAGVFCALGIMTGNLLWAVLSLAGLAALSGVITVLQLAGGAYLIWMGVGSIRSVRRKVGPAGAVPEQVAQPAAQPAPALSRFRAWRTGLTTNLANPKAILFFGAIFAQFVTPGLGWAGAGIILAVILPVGLAWFVAVGLLVGSLAPVIQRYERAIDVVTGVIFCVIGVVMVVEGVSGLTG